MPRKMERITPAEYARRRGLHSSTVYNAIREGRCPREPDGTIRVDIADRLWPEVAHKTGVKVQTVESSGGESVTLNEARTRKALAEAESKELKLAQQRGELVAIEDVARVYYGILRKLRNRLRAIPGRISALVVAEPDVGEVRRMLSGEIDDALRMVDLDDEEGGGDG